MGHLQATIQSRAVDLSHQGRQNWWTRGNLGNLEGDPKPLRDWNELLTNLLGQVMRLEVTLALVHEVDLDIGLVAGRAEEVVANQAIEVEGRGGSHVYLEVGDFGHGAEKIGDLPSRGIGLFEAESFWCIDHNLEFGLVVVGEHLNRCETYEKGCH
jgi:hypothetical protein